jgi:HEPN domain-containing protein
MPPEPGSPAAWLAYAHSDLLIANATIPGVMLENLCFHAQQAAEKCLKGVLADREISFQKTHSIERLIGLLPEDIVFPPELCEASDLTEYATIFRYPGDLEPVTIDEYHRLLAIAQKVVRWAEQTLGSTA